MKQNRMVLTKLILFLLVSLIGIYSIYADTGNEESALSLRMIAVAKAAASPSDMSDQEAILQEQYDAAQASFDAQEYEKALEAFEALGEFSDSSARAADSKRKWRAASYKEAMALYDAEQYYQAKEIFESLEKYEKSRSYVYNCTMKILRMEYQQAKDLYADGDYESAKILFESFGSYHDSEERAQAADDMIKAQEQAAAELNSYETALVLKEAGDLEGARDAMIEAGDCGDATDQLYAIIRLMALRDVYENAQEHFTNADYENAYDLFVLLGDFEDSSEKAKIAEEAWQASVYEQATALQSDDPNHAYILFLFLGDYKDSADITDELQAVITDLKVYNAANALEKNGEYAQAKLGFEAIVTYSNSQDRVAKLNESIQQIKDFKQAAYLMEIGEEEQANAAFEALGDYQNASEMIVPITPKFTAKQLRDDKTSPVSPVYTAADGTKHRYQIYKGVHTWVEAKAFCEVLGGHLATVTTAEENEFVHTFMIDSGYLTAYFGLSDEERTGDWIWVTGEPFDYTNWDSGEPSRSARERYGMYFYKHTKGTWNDSHFYEHAEVDPGCSYICEWDE